MDFASLPGFDIEADLASLTAFQRQQRQQQHQQHPQFPSPSGSPPKVFFITNCGSLLGKTIAQVALDNGHLVAACAREKHLADLSVPFRWAKTDRGEFTGGVSRSLCVIGV
jgi:hypothetical protein